MNTVNIKTKIYSGENSLKHLKTLKNKNIWLVCDKFLIKSGNLKSILEFIDDSNKISVFDKVIPDPPLDVIGKGIATAIKIRPDIIIAYGGGSAIDTAKGIIYFGKKQNVFNKAKFIAIPTTSGTGSEVTSATVITDTKVKHIIFDDCMLPDEAILDANLTLSVPKEITANTGMDVLTHAMEAYVSINSNVYSDSLSEKSMELIIESLIQCYKDGNDISSRMKMHESSNLAGIAFNIAGLGINHSLAHQIGGEFHIPHGLANALLLNAVIAYNCQEKEILKKYSKLAYKSGMVEKNKDDYFTVRVLKEYINTLMKLMKMPTRLRECGIEKEKFENAKFIMAENALKDNCTNSNPIKINKDSAVNLLESIY